MEILGKQSLTNLVADKTGISKKDTAAVIQGLLDIIAEEVNEKGNIVTLKGFGRFTKKTKEGSIKHIKTGKKLDYATTRLAFKCSPTLKK